MLLIYRGFVAACCCPMGLGVDSRAALAAMVCITQVLIGSMP